MGAGGQNGDGVCQGSGAGGGGGQNGGGWQVRARIGG